MGRVRRVDVGEMVYHALNRANFHSLERVPDTVSPARVVAATSDAPRLCHSAVVSRPRSSFGRLGCGCCVLALRSSGSTRRCSVRSCRCDWGVVVRHGLSVNWEVIATLAAGGEPFLWT
jgi:hypothetical protein